MTVEKICSLFHVMRARMNVPFSFFQRERMNTLYFALVDEDEKRQKKPILSPALYANEQSISNVFSM